MVVEEVVEDLFFSSFSSAERIAAWHQRTLWPVRHALFSSLGEMDALVPLFPPPEITWWIAQRPW